MKSRSSSRKMKCALARELLEPLEIGDSLTIGKEIYENLPTFRSYVYYVAQDPCKEFSTRFSKTKSTLTIERIR